MIKTYAHRLMTPAELVSLGKEVSKLIDTIDFGFPLMDQLKTVIQKDLTVLDASAESIADESTEDILGTLDKVRDRNYLSIRGVIEASFYEDIVAKIEAAKLLAGLIKDHDWSLHALGYAKETEQLHKLFAALATNEAKNAIQALDLQDKVEKLESSQKEFETTFERFSGNQEVLPENKDAKMTLKRHLDTLFRNIELLNETVKTGEYDILMDDINKAINAVMVSVRARKPELVEEEV